MEINQVPATEGRPNKYKEFFWNYLFLPLLILWVVLILSGGVIAYIVGIPVALFFIFGFIGSARKGDPWNRRRPY